MAAIYIARIEKVKDPTIRVWLSVDDIEIVETSKWHRVRHAKHEYAYGSVKENGIKRTVSMHGYIAERMLGRPLVKGEIVDHIDGNGMHNNRENLRVCTSKQNAWNSRRVSRSKSGYIGVEEVETKNGKYWRAQIQHDNKKHNLGKFDSPEAAHQAYCEAAKKLRGEYVNLEVPTLPPPPLPDYEPFVNEWLLEVEPEKQVAKPVVIHPVNFTKPSIYKPADYRVPRTLSNEELRAIFDPTRVLTDEDTQPIVIPEGWPYNVKK